MADELTHEEGDSEDVLSPEQERLHVIEVRKIAEAHGFALPNWQPVSRTCPKCDMTTWHPVDVKMGYCANCHEYTGLPSGDGG